MKNVNAPGSDFEALKESARQNPEVAEYLNSFSVVIGDLVLARRLVKKYTQKQLADMTGTTQARISLIESGTGNVETDTLNKVFRALGLVSLNPEYQDEAATAEAIY